MARPVALDVADTLGDGDAPGSKPDISPSGEKRAKMMDKVAHDGSQGSEKENFDRQKGTFTRAGSLQGKELKRQFSMSDAANRDRGHDSGLGSSISSSSQPGSSGASQSGGQSSVDRSSVDRSSVDRCSVDRSSELDKPLLGGGERSRGKDRGAGSRHRIHSESRIPDTDRRFGADQQHHGDRESRHGKGERGREGERGGRHDLAGSGKKEDRKGEHRGEYRGEVEADRKERHR